MTDLFRKGQNDMAKQTLTKGGSWTRKMTGTKGITQREAFNLIWPENTTPEPEKVDALKRGEQVRINLLLSVQAIPDANGRMRYQKQVYGWVPA